MKKRKWASILIILIFVGCELGKDTYSWKQFTFKNFTENNYTNTKISAGEIIGDKILIRHTENIGDILPKLNNEYTETITTKTEIYDRVFLDFINNDNDIGCFLIEFSDNRKLFIEVGYFSFYSVSLDSPNSFEIEITENDIATFYKSNEVNGIRVENFEIVR